MLIVNIYKLLAMYQDRYQKITPHMVYEVFQSTLPILKSKMMNSM